MTLGVRVEAEWKEERSRVGEWMGCGRRRRRRHRRGRR